MGKFSARSGFSIIEVLLTVALFLVFFVAIQQVFPFHKRVIVRSENTSIATSLAQEKMEEWIKKGYDNVVATYDPSHSGVLGILENGRYDSNPNSKNYIFTKDVTLSYLDPANLPNPSSGFSTVIKVNVTISFIQNDQTNSVNLVNYLTSLNRP